MAVHEGAWAEGTPAWVDLLVPDRHVAQAFYGPLLGWEFDEAGSEDGYYATATVAGRRAAGIAEDLPGTQPPPPAWTTYLAVEDIDATVERAVRAGAQLLMEPTEAMDLGRMAMLSDPTGAVFGLWQAGTHTGADVVDEPGTLSWNEVMTRGYDEALTFYRDVFGYEFGDMSTPDFRYSTLDLLGRPVGGIGKLAATAPAETRPAWVTYFSVADTDAVVARALALGGTLIGEPEDTPFGRMAVLRGPFGESFAVLETSEPSSAPMS